MTITIAGEKKEYAEGTIRISFGKYNTLDDAIDIATMLNSIING